MVLCAGLALSVPRALVTGAAGQDGSYLTELLCCRGYDVRGIDRGDIDLLDSDALVAAMRDVGPGEIYNLAGPSFVPASWDEPVEVARLGAVGSTVLLEAIREVDPAIRLFQASSAEVYGVPAETPQTEATPILPISPYGAAKAYGNFIVAAYRRRHGLHASCGILYNHESPRRSTEFLPSKVAHGAAEIAVGRRSELALGDLDVQRDWGYAPDYVVATGELHSVRELVELAFAHAGLDWREHVRVDESLKRGQRYQLLGDASKAQKRLGWKPSVSFEELVVLLVDAALKELA